MKETLRLSLVQSNIFWEEKEKNISHLSKLLNNVKRPDVILLPEMFNTAFSPKSVNLAEKMNGRTVEWMRFIVKEKKCAIAGSLMIEENSKIYNRLVWISKHGEIHTYDKKHLFSLANEGQKITKGESRLIVNCVGWRICPLLCYDLRFPVFSRNNVDYDILIYLANWPMKRINDWNILLQARSIENQCYVFGVNRIGTDYSGVYFNGETGGYNAFGQKICSSQEKEEIINIEIDKKDLIIKRKKRNFLKDRDNFKLI